MERRRPIKGMIFRNKPETSSSESETEKSDQESVSLFHRASLDIPDPREHQHETSDDDHEQVEHNSLQGDKFINNTYSFLSNLDQAKFFTDSEVFSTTSIAFSQFIPLIRNLEYMTSKPFKFAMEYQ